MKADAISSNDNITDTNKEIEEDLTEADYKKERRKLQNDLKKTRAELEEIRREKNTLSSDLALNKSVIFHLTEKLDMAKIIHKDLEIAAAKFSTPLRPQDSNSDKDRYTVLDETYCTSYFDSRIEEE